MATTSDAARGRVAAIAVALVRLGAGITLGSRPARYLRWEPAIEGTSMPLLLRTVGIRDLAVGAGTAGAVVTGSTADVRRWLAAGIVSDALDVVAGVAGARTTGARSAVSALMAAPMVGLGIYALRALRDA